MPFVVTVTLAAPIRFPFTLPPELTLTTRLFEERHLTEGAFVPFVVIVFFKRYDCPTPIRILVLFNLIFVFNLDTLTRQVALTPDCTKVQVIVQLPYFLPVTLPFALTVAIFEFELLQFEAVLAFDGATILRIVKLARTPLIISGPAEGDVTRWYRQFARLVLKLNRDEDYEVDEKKKVVGILDPGITKVEDYLGIDNLYEPNNTALIGYLNNAIKAKELFLRDRDYVVTGGEVLIVDEHTGRILPGRRYNEGLHQAIEAKEGVEVKAENQTFATITLQNYFR